MVRDFVQVLCVLFRNCSTPFGRYVSNLVSKYTDGSKRLRIRPLPSSAPIRFTCAWDTATGSGAQKDQGVTGRP